MTDHYQVAVIGAGPGGASAARQAINRGAKVCLIEAGTLGGACLNVGCIPTKAMLHASELCKQMREAKQFGLSSGEVTVDGPAFMARVSKVVSVLVGGLDKKYQTSEIDLIRGRAALTGADQIEIQLNDGGVRSIQADSIVIATGSSPARPGLFPWDSPRVMTTDQAVVAEDLPESILIIGGGVIGCEFATVYCELGIPTTLVEMLDRLSAVLDQDASKLIERSLKRRKVKVHIGSGIVSMTADESGVRAEMADGQIAQAAYALIAVGRKPNIENIGLAAAGVETKDGIIPVDDYCRTNVPNIYAVGDVAESRQYAHLASRMGVVAADNATGYECSDDRTAVPVGQFTHPEVASVGATEAQARTQHPAARAASVQYQGTGVGWAYGEKDGLVKIIADSVTQEIYGGLIVGYHASDSLQELALAMKHGLTVQQLADTIHTHPTFVESIGFAADAWLGDQA